MKTIRPISLNYLLRIIFGFNTTTKALEEFIIYAFNKLRLTLWSFDKLKEIFLRNLALKYSVIIRTTIG